MAKTTLYNHSKENLMRVLQDRSSNISFETPALSQLHPLGKYKFEMFGNSEIEFTEQSMKLFFDHIGNIPMPYYKRSDQDLQSHMIMAGISNAYAANKSASEPRVNLAMVRPSEDKPYRVLGVPNERKPFIPLADVVRAVESGVGKGNELNRWRLTDEGLTVSYTSKNVTTEPRVGDITQGGVEVFFSDSYHRNPEIHWFAFRLSCSNGMILPIEGQRISIVGNTVDDILESLEAEANRLMSSVEDNLLSPFAATAHERLDDVGVFLDQISRDFQLHRTVRDSLMRSAASNLSSADATQYDAINLLTALQHDESLSVAERISVQVSGAIEAHDHYRRCSRCHSILN